MKNIQITTDCVPQSMGTHNGNFTFFIYILFTQNPKNKKIFFLLWLPELFVPACFPIWHILKKYELKGFSLTIKIWEMPGVLWEPSMLWKVLSNPHHTLDKHLFNNKCLENSTNSVPTLKQKQGHAKYYNCSTLPYTLIKSTVKNYSYKTLKEECKGNLLCHVVSYLKNALCI